MGRDMLAYETELRERGFSLLCGVDEAGRGPLAGGVCAAAVILDRANPIEGLDDSKKLSEKKRERLFDEIVEKAFSFGIAFADEGEIDAYNILNATFLAMRRAVEQLKRPPDCILVDGNRDPGFCDGDGRGIYTLPIVKGDGKSASIAAASILAKVSRDRAMLELDREYPQYEFAKHKGYPTKRHYELLGKYGPCPVHRKTFLRTLAQHTEGKDGE